MNEEKRGILVRINSCLSIRTILMALLGIISITFSVALLYATFTSYGTAIEELKNKDKNHSDAINKIRIGFVRVETNQINLMAGQKDIMRLLRNGHGR